MPKWKKSATFSVIFKHDGACPTVRHLKVHLEDYKMPKKLDSESSFSKVGN